MKDITGIRFAGTSGLAACLVALTAGPLLAATPTVERVADATLQPRTTIVEIAPPAGDGELGTIRFVGGGVEGGRGLPFGGPR